MAYTKGTDAIVKNCYEIYLAPHNTSLDTDWAADFNTGSPESRIDRGNLLTAASTQWGSDTNYTTANDWGAIGRTEAEPTITTESGEEVKLNDCNTLQISAVVNVAFNDLQVTKDNWESLKNLFDSGTVDVLYYDANNEDASIIVRNIQLNAFPKITGNAKNMVEVTGSKECSDISDNFKMLDSDNFYTS